MARQGQDSRLTRNSPRTDSIRVDEDHTRKGCASGMARTKTTVLLTVEEADEALSKPVAYRPPKPDPALAATDPTLYCPPCGSKRSVFLNNRRKRRSVYNPHLAR